MTYKTATKANCLNYRFQFHRGVLTAASGALPAAFEALQAPSETLSVLLPTGNGVL